jgi:hypothetical protein
VACPYFYPGEPFAEDPRIRPARFPLGAAHKGVCRAAPGEPFEPSEDTLRSVCNFGYGRDSCPRFPAGSEADAVRFSLVSRPGEAMRVLFVLERDFAPVRHGTSASCESPAADGDCLARQAEVFAANYARKTRCA